MTKELKCIFSAGFQMSEEQVSIPGVMPHAAVCKIASSPVAGRNSFLFAPFGLFPTPGDELGTRGAGGLRVGKLCLLTEFAVSDMGLLQLPCPLVVPRPAGLSDLMPSAQPTFSRASAALGWWGQGGPCADSSWEGAQRLAAVSSRACST